MNDRISGYLLDGQQQAIVLDESKHLLVVAGAGSGKTLTILGKIHYLIKYKNILPSEILCISFTRTSANSLKEKILREFNVDMPVYTFHKLSLEILNEEGKDFVVAEQDTLDNIINNFFNIDILCSEMHIRLVLRYFNIKKRNKLKENYLKFIKTNYEQIELLKKLICTFLKLFKTNNYKIQDFVVFLHKSKKTVFYKKYIKEKTFLIIALNIYLIYINYLKENKEIDFDDMIINATCYINEKGIPNKYKYVIIDEYQDTSYIRFLLITSILNKTNAKLMVVGDDFQSIYRFTGCDISLFLDFNQYFNNSKVMKIENTYRNSQELISVAGEFVMKNKRQIPKKLKSIKCLPKPIEVIYYKDIKKSFCNLIEYIYANNKSPIMIVGRNNHDINIVLGDKFKLKENGRLIYLNNFDIELYYLTAHKSKGLEEENVIIINLEDKWLGFPCKIIDDKILRFVSSSCDKYLYSEERRLFYVALTRTKNKVYLLAPTKRQSVFLKELICCYSSKINFYHSL